MSNKKYDFDQVIDRSNTNSSKWSPKTLKETFNSEDVLPMWVADMDFRIADEIIDETKKFVEHGIYGYSFRPDSYYEAIIDWTKKRFNWEIKQEWIEYTPGVVPAISYMVQSYCKPGDKILIQEPVYYPFAESIKNNGCTVVNNELIEEDGNYSIDFDDFKEKVKDPDVKLFILCSPHNPIAKLWSEEELIKLGKLCIENDVIVIADEIHNDLVYPGNNHIMFASLNEEFAMNSITCTAPSKTFNLAGMQASNIIIPNSELRKRFQKVLKINNIGLQNPLSIVAVETAYRYGDKWLDQVLEYMDKNIDYIEEFLKDRLPKARFRRPEATYLAWIDLREYESDGGKLEEKLIKGKVGLDGGTWFGKSGEGFMRLNFACPRPILKEGLERIANAIL